MGEEVRLLASAIGSLFTAGLAARFLVAHGAGLRLADSLALLVAAIALVSEIIEAVENFGWWWAGVGVTAAFVIGSVLAAQALRDYRAEDRKSPVGVFVLSRPTPGVRNWVELPWNRTPPPPENLSS